MHKPKTPINLLVVVSIHDINWTELFKGKQVNDCDIVVKQANYNELVNVSYQEKKDSHVYVSIKGIKENLIQQDPVDAFDVHFVLFRSVCHGRHNQDSRNVMLTFLHGAIPSVNSIESIWLNSERLIGYGLLNRIKKRFGFEKFPLIPQTSWPSFTTMKFAPSSPYVLKFGHAHAGYGKILVESESSGVLGDYAGLLALTPMYCTGEIYIKYDHEIRIQKIGDHIRALKRRSQNWKGNVGNTAVVEETELKSHWKEWIIWISEEFGGLDICAMDVLVTQDGAEYILEINDTAVGLMNKLLKEDSTRMCDVTLVRMKEKLFTKEETKSTLYDEFKYKKLLDEVEKMKKTEKELKEKIAQLEKK